MDGKILVTYVVICNSDSEKTITASELLADEKISKAIKTAFCGGSRNVELHGICEEVFKIKTARTEYTFEIEKDDYADALTLAEDDAKRNKRLKKGCDRVMLVDFKTV